MTRREGEMGGFFGIGIENVMTDDEERDARLTALMNGPIRRAKPRCGVCGKPVEEFYEVEDPGMNRVVFTAVCHGARERVVVTGRETVQDLGVAFIPEGPPGLPSSEGSGAGAIRVHDELRSSRFSNALTIAIGGPLTPRAFGEFAEAIEARAGRETTLEPSREMLVGPEGFDDRATGFSTDIAEVARAGPPLPENVHRISVYARTAEEACGEEYRYPGFGSLMRQGRCAKRKGHALGPPPRNGHGGEEKC